MGPSQVLTMPLRRTLCQGAAVVAGLPPLGGASAQHAIAVSAKPCANFTVTGYAGAHFRISSIKVTRTTCATARRVVRGFYGQVIGSSGAAYAAGYGCAYYGAGSAGGSGAHVRCGSGASGRGSRQVRWLERSVSG
jgi:hypothetical protein